MKKILTIAVILLLVVLGLAWVNNSKRNMAGKIRRLTADASETINEAADKIKDGAVEVKEQAEQELARVTESEPAERVETVEVVEEVEIEGQPAEELEVAKSDLDESSRKARANIDQLLTEKEREKLDKEKALNASSSPEKVVISKVGNEEITLVPIGKNVDHGPSPEMYNASSDEKTPESPSELQQVAKNENMAKKQSMTAASLNTSGISAPAPDARSSWISSKQPTKVVINYSPGATGISDAARQGLSEIIAAVKAQPLRTLRIIGHSDNNGSILDQRRASYLRTEEVVAYLESQGVDPANIHYDHMGYKMPLVVAGTDMAQARNRRVEVYLRQN